MGRKKEELLKEEQSESEFFDKYYKDADARQQLNNYILPQELINQVLEPANASINDHEYAYSLMGKLDGKKVLDYGAGDGWNSICFAKAKAKVWAIDVSSQGRDLIRKKALANAVSDLVIAEIRNCYDTQFPANMFDIVYGGGILHHLDVEAAGQEINRVLKSDGVAVFYEPIRDTKIMDYVKAIVLRLVKRKPSEETENESPMTSERIRTLRSYFKVVNYRYFNVFTSLNQLINSKRLKYVLMRADDLCMRVLPGFKKLGRAVVIELREPVNK